MAACSVIHRPTVRTYTPRMEARARLSAVVAGSLLALAAAGAIGHFAFADTNLSGKHGVTSATSNVAATVGVNTSCEQTAQSQVQIDICTERVATEAQGVLNAALAKERAHIRPALVNASERRWIVYRNVECRAEASPNQGGSIQPTIYGSCVIALTEARIVTVRATTHYATL